MSHGQSKAASNRLQKSDVTSWLQSRQSQQRGRATAVAADSLPPELLLQIFRHLSPRALVSCSMVCRLWAEFAASESLWRPICARCFPKQPEPFGVPLGANGGVWKATFFNRLRKHASSRKYLNSLANFTDVDFRVTLDFLGDSGCSLEASVSARVRNPGRLSTVIAFTSSAGANSLPSSMRRVSQLVCRAIFPAAHPDLLPASECPRRAAVLFNRVTGCQPLTGLSRASRAGDKDASCVTVHLLGDGLLVGEWTNESDSTLAFVRLQLAHELVANAARTAALGGSADGGAAANAGSTKAAATVSKSARRGVSTASVRSQRGSAIAASIPAVALLPSRITGLSAVLLLKEHRGSEFVYNTWRCLDLTPAAGDDWLACELIDPRRRGDHVPYDCEPEFRWRAGPAGLEGRIRDACYCDFVLYAGPSGAGSGVVSNAAGGALWSLSEPAFFANVGDQDLDGGVEYEYDGPRLSLSVSNSTGRLRLLVVKDAIGDRGYLVGAWLELSRNYLALREA